MWLRLTIHHYAQHKYYKQPFYEQLQVNLIWTLKSGLALLTKYIVDLLTEYKLEILYARNTINVVQE